MPSSAALPAKPLATSATVPSPPAATTIGTPRFAASRASSAAWPGRAVSATSGRSPCRPSASSARANQRRRRPPAAGLNTISMGAASLPRSCDTAATVALHGNDVASDM
jgi:hypothetical protein